VWQGWEMSYFRPAGGKVEITNSDGRKRGNPHSAGRVSNAQPETEMYTTVLTKHKFLITSYIHIITSLHNA